MESKYFLVQIKRSKDGVYDKGVVIKGTLNSAKQSAHAYLAAYAYEKDANIDYVLCEILDTSGNRMYIEIYTTETRADNEFNNY